MRARPTAVGRWRAGYCAPPLTPRHLAALVLLTAGLALPLTASLSLWPGLDLWGHGDSAADAQAGFRGAHGYDWEAEAREEAEAADSGGLFHMLRRLLQEEGPSKLTEEKDPATGCPLPKVDMEKDHYSCVVWKKVCVDQNVIVSYDPDTHPKHSMGTLPYLNISEIMYNLPSKFGIGDRYRKGSALRFPALYVRPSNDMEEEAELQGDPTFSVCTMPMLLYAHYPFNAAETYRYIFEKLVTLQLAGFFNKHLTLVPGVPPGTRVPSYTKFWYGSLTDKAVVSLSELSARKPTTAPSNATWEGRHVRCFETMLGCRVRYDRYGLKFYRAAQYVVDHYKPQYLSQSAAFEQRLFAARGVSIPEDPSVLKLVFISRNDDQSAVGRTILNEQELVAACNAAPAADLPPPAWGSPYKKFFCFAHTFGESQLMDVWVMRRVDAILGMHGAGLTNGLYMKPGGAIIEVRPFGFSGRESWANRYARFKASTPAEAPWPIHWYGIDTFNASLSEPGMFEKEDKPHFSKFRVIKARDRHVRITWPSMRHQLLTVALSARTHARYMSLRYGGSYYITDTLEQAEWPGNDPHVKKDLQRNFTSIQAEWDMALKIPVDQAALDFAATPDKL
ncbi:hypothetical protein HXX76_014497 [Chlamydomonas incerta]|uniref:Glycosyltransferase 61 catalytic domain-containing protein n=1 Tax=Chlamydomonas incerta TaxID=51695 RepID=A0A835SLD9_CHLIN|nr:hypothetical protein HXX76_014497 [Chlamydomonas incerta]|eukprot:KAG2424444.1 hypothetical protein HXX76_014497 [Chlamydomonas incerta]